MALLIVCTAAATIAGSSRLMNAPMLATSPCTRTSLTAYVQDQTNTDELKNGNTPYVATADKLAVQISCPAPGAGLTAGSVGAPIRVKVTAGYKLPVMNGMLQLLRLPQVAKINLAASSTMRLEREPARITEATGC